MAALGLSGSQYTLSGTADFGSTLASARSTGALLSPLGRGQGTTSSTRRGRGAGVGNNSGFGSPRGLSPSSFSPERLRAIATRDYSPLFLEDTKEGKAAGPAPGSMLAALAKGFEGGETVGFKNDAPDLSDLL